MKKTLLLLAGSGLLFVSCLKDPGSITYVKTKDTAGNYKTTFAVGDTIITEAAIGNQNFETYNWYQTGSNLVLLNSSSAQSAMFVANQAGATSIELKIENCNDNSKCRQEYGSANITVQ
jgi:hypothetical protein